MLRNSLKQTLETLDKVKDVCANFSAMVRSMRNHFPDMQFSCVMRFGADAWSELFSISVQGMVLIL